VSRFRSDTQAFELRFGVGEVCVGKVGAGEVNRQESRFAPRRTATVTAACLLRGHAAPGFCASRPHLRQPPQPLDVGVAGPDPVATGQAAASPLLSGTRILLQRLQAVFDHEIGGGFTLHPLAKSGFLPGAPFTPGTSPDIGLPRCHLPIAGQAQTPPRRLRVLVRLDWLNPGSPHDGGGGFMIQAPGHGIVIPGRSCHASRTTAGSAGRTCVPGGLVRPVG
jgi:hypothetical protein